MTWTAHFFLQPHQANFGKHGKRLGYYISFLYITYCNKISIQNFNGFILDDVTIKNYFKKLLNQLAHGFL